MVPYCVSCVVRWKKKGGKCHVWLWEPLDFSRRYHIVISRFHYSGTCINARISCSNHVRIHRINHSDRWGDQSPTFFSEIFTRLLPGLNRDSIIWPKDKGRVLNVLTPLFSRSSSQYEVGAPTMQVGAPWIRMSIKYSHIRVTCRARWPYRFYLYEL